MTRTQNLEPLIESDEREFYDSGVPSTVAIAQHPLHPVIVTFPIAFLVSVALSDVVYWFTNSSFWAEASFWLLVGGLISGVVAAITGMLDFLKIGRVRKHKAGWYHMIGNIAVLVLSLINLLIRWGNVTGSILPIGLTLSIIVAAILGITGWFGGELVYRHKISVIGNGNPNQA